MALTEEATKRILNKLQGYILVDDNEDTDLEDMNYDNAITNDEIELFYSQALSECLTYCYLVNFPTETIIDEETGEEVVQMDSLFKEALYMWSAGLIWRKYDIRANDQIDDSNTFGYGDSLIVNAKNALKPFMYSKFACW